MEKTDKERMNAIGQKLEIGTSGIHQKKEHAMWRSLYSIPHRLVAGIIYVMIQVLLSFLSWISAESTHLMIGTGYPYSPPSLATRIMPELLFTSALHAGNGLFLLPKDTQLIPKRSLRIIIFLGNLVSSLIIFWLVANASPVYISNTLYGAYDKFPQVSSSKTKNYSRF